MCRVIEEDKEITETIEEVEQVRIRFKYLVWATRKLIFGIFAAF
jgi:hypothetical protein